MLKLFVLIALVVVCVGVLLVAFSTSRYREPYQGSYLPYPPPYLPPYPYAPHPLQSLVGCLKVSFTLIAIIFALYVALQYIKRIEVFRHEISPIIEKGDSFSTDSTGGDFHPIMDTFVLPVPYSYEPFFTVTDGWHHQEAAFADLNAACEAAQQLVRHYSGRVFVGEKPGDSYPFKLLIGPYSDIQALKDVHGKSYIRVPASEGIILYDPTR